MIINYGDTAPLTRLADGGELESLLQITRDLVHQLLLRPDLQGNALFVPQLDDLMRRAAGELVQAPPGPGAGDLVLHVATEVYETGGHTRVIEDAVRALPERRHILVITDVLHHYRSGRLELGLLRERFSGLGLRMIFLQAESLAAKARELAALVAELAPEVILLFGHHFDSVTNAAISGDSAPRVLYLHHCDHNPALGATREDLRHVDLAMACHEICKGTYPFPHALLRMCVHGATAADTEKHEQLIGVTCGSAHKYGGHRVFSYGQLLAALFSQGVAHMFHIGTMHEAQQEVTLSEVRALGQDAAKVTFIPNVPSLTEALQMISPAFYMGSHPVAGGRAVLEALGVGLPIVYPGASGITPLLCSDMALGASLVIESLGDVPGVVHRLKTERKALAAGSQRLFEELYSPRAFRAALVDLVAGAGASDARTETHQAVGMTPA